MSPESFTDLALRVIAGEAAPAARRALEAEIAATPARRDEFEQLRLAHDVLRTAAPMAEAMRNAEPQLPAHRLNELRTAVRQEFGPASRRRPAAPWVQALRWIFAGGGLAMLGAFILFLGLANRTIEVGVYASDTVRGGGAGVAQADIPSARLVTFDQDAPFDQWQNAPLTWNERAKIWVDNERDLLHVVHRIGHGQVVTETRPLAPAGDAQRAQIEQVVADLNR